jgi:hypothetical protein
MTTVYVELWTTRVSSQEDPDEWFDYLSLVDSSDKRTYWEFTSDLSLNDTKRLVSEFVREHQKWYNEVTKKVYQNNGTIFNITRFNVYDDESDDYDSD